MECASPIAAHELVQDDRRLALVAASSLSRPWGKGLARLGLSMRSPPGPLGVYGVVERPVSDEASAFRVALMDAAR